MLLQELKVLAKRVGRKETLLILSPHYQKLQKFRHVMTHFIQTFQTYIVGDVLQTSWELFEKNLYDAKNLDQLYEFHTSYLKNILFM